MSTAASTNQYREAAKDKFDSLMKLWRASVPPSSYWKLGNSFDTMIDFLDIDSICAPDVANIVVTQYNSSLKNLGGYDAAWFDDFGWWTVATQRAVGKPFFRRAFKEFHDIMLACWSRFTGNAPYVWERRATGTFNSYGPAVDGGVWNEYWEGTSPTWPGPKDGEPNGGEPADPNALHGIQNTVTNAIYLIAAQRLAVSTNPDARVAAEREFHFLNTWFDVQPDPLWWQCSPKVALVRERVSHFSNKNKDRGFQDNWAWTGDQGLILGGLVDRMSLMSGGPGERAALLDRTKQLLAGVRDFLATKGVLQPWSDSGVVTGSDNPDYETGPGVFWRNVLHAWKTDPDLRAFLSEPEYQQFVGASADAAKSSTDGTFDSLTNDVAVLVAATVMLR